MDKKYKNGLALSGGGSKGLAHIGVLKYFEEQQINFDRIAATSSGAIVGGLYACGMKSSEILDFFVSTKIFSTSHLAFSNKGFVKTKSLKKEFINRIGNPNIEDLEISISILATDLNNANLTVFDQGSLIEAILASSAYPGVFIPMIIGETTFADGGLINNFPIDIVKSDSENTIGVNLSSVKYVGNQDLNNMMDILNRSYEIIRKNSEIKSKHLADIYLTPLSNKNVGVFDTKKDILRENYNDGYKTAVEYFSKNPEKLSKLKY